MKKILLYTFLFCLTISSYGQISKQCGFGKIQQQIMSHPDYDQLQLDYKKMVKEFQSFKMDTVIVIPTVVHVVYKNATENISMTQIRSQIDALNRDFRRLNADTTNVASGFSIADVKFEFSLATRTPDGSTTNGVTRTSTTLDDIGLTSQYYNLVPAWNNERYLNIWVCDVGDVNLGFAFPPNAPGVTPQEDGIVIGPQYFGTIGSVIFPDNQYNLGRTTTHEVGHYFNLLHIWGSDQVVGCASDDEITDTPNQGLEIYDCPSSNSSCGSNDMLSNFLGYIDDRCMGNFTLGQKNRMRMALYLLRDSLQYGASLGIVGIGEINPLSKTNVFPNPSNGIFQLSFPQDVILDKVQIELVNIAGKSIAFKTKKRIDGISIEISNSSDGVYFLKLKEGNFQATKKLIKH